MIIFVSKNEKSVKINGAAAASYFRRVLAKQTFCKSRMLLVHQILRDRCIMYNLPDVSILS